MICQHTLLIHTYTKYEAGVFSPVAFQKTSSLCDIFHQVDEQNGKRQQGFLAATDRRGCIGDRVESGRRDCFLSNERLV